MRFIRKSNRKRNFTSWTPRTSALAHEAKARKRIAAGNDGEPRRIPEGEYLGTLLWQAASGEVRKMVVRQGNRSNNIKVDGMREAHGWDFIMRKLRSKLSIRKLRFGTSSLQSDSH